MHYKSSIQFTHSFSDSEINDLNVEMKSRVGRDDVSCTAGSVSIVRRTDELSLLALLKLADAFVPAADDLADADFELKWNTARNRTVENTAVWELASVVNFDHRTPWN